MNSAKGMDSSGEQAQAARRILPRYFEMYIRHGVWVVLLLHTTSWVSLAANLWMGRLSKYAGKLYACGLCGLLAHLCFVPFVTGPVKRICDWMEEGQSDGLKGGKGREKGEKEGLVEVLKGWLGMHKLRMVVADVPAWVCCIMGSLASVSV